MTRDSSNTWLSGADQPNAYLSTADVVIVERERTIRLLGDIVGYHFGGRKPLQVLDLGCGDGEFRFGGALLVADVVKPTSERSERWQFAMWQDWMNERLAEIGGEVGVHDDLPGAAMAKPENKPSGLIDQLELLQRVGFRDVDCYYKYGVFALFGGTK
jgi:hypothetical protein